VKRKPNERRQRGLKLEFRKMEWKVVREREREERTTCVSEKEEVLDLAWMEMIGAT